MSVFKFKQFEVNQFGCAMRINTDGVLLAAFAAHKNPKRILDIGTGTGVIALMLAQRFETALVTAVEIDETASNTAKRNFEKASFNSRLQVYLGAIEQFSSAEKFDLIVSNPPFFVNDLKSMDERKGMARHATEQFFSELTKKADELLTVEGSFWFILPVKQSQLLIADALNIGLFVKRRIEIHSDKTKPAFRWIVCLSRKKVPLTTTHFNIYESEKVHTKAYQELLKDFFIGY